MIIDRNFETSIICTFGEVFSMNSIVPFLKFISYTCTNDLENNPAVISDKLVRGALFKLGHINSPKQIFLTTLSGGAIRLNESCRLSRELLNEEAGPFEGTELVLRAWRGKSNI